MLPHIYKRIGGGHAMRYSRYDYDSADGMYEPDYERSQADIDAEKCDNDEDSDD